MPTLAEIARLLNAPLSPESAGGTRITGVAGLPQATAGEISFLSSDAFVRAFIASAASAVIVDRRVKLPPSVKTPVIVVDDAELATSQVLELFASPIPRPPPGVDPSARIAADTTLGEGVAVGANVVVGARCRIGNQTVLHPGVVIGDDVTIGGNCEFFPNVVVRERITIGNRVIIHAGSVLGTDGFGYRWDGRKHAKVPQIGTVIIEDDVEIGSCVCIDRAKMGATRVGMGTKIDNLVQIAHNCVIGRHCIIVGQVGLAGSVTMGAGVVLGGQTAVRDHISIGDGAMAAARSAIHEDVDPKMVVSGMPALPHRQSLREQAALRHLPDMRAQIRKLQEEIEALKRAAQGK
jgi:UDP-3-O-[3-hydroxymyristoyl] glucosamine N-acyltransferase